MAVSPLALFPLATQSFHWHMDMKKGGAFANAALFCHLPENQCVPHVPEEQEPPQLLPPVLAKGI